MHVVSTATVIAVEWTLLGLCLFLVLARLFLRLYLEHRKLIFSDYLLCLAFLSGVCLAALDLKLMLLGFVFVSWFSLLTTLYLNKAALLSFLFYIFPSSLRSIFYSLWALSIYSGLSYVISILLVSLSCLPHGRENLNLVSCGTLSQLTLWIATWALHFSSDIFIFILPLSILRTLKLNWKKKLGLYTTFGFGIFSISACLVRFLIVKLTYPNVPTTNIELWCPLDSDVGLMVACLPALRPYLNLGQGSLQRISSHSSCRKNVLNRASVLDYPLTMPQEIHS
ncbi:hypothetical protein BJX96DRAFT_170035 [Aspergillus floccosus]